MQDTPASLDILADLEGAQTPRNLCAVAKVRRERPDLAGQFDRALASSYSAEAIAKWFTDREYTISGQLIRNHRNGRCQQCRTRTTSSAT